MIGPVRTGLHALGIGSGADPTVIEAVARRAESSGFSTLWCGEHVVMVDRPDTLYPYADDGHIAVPADADWLNPMAVLAYCAAVTSRIRLGTGVLLLPEHNPVVMAKHAASVDVLSSGRLVLGIGIGWSAAEFAALGVPFARRIPRTREYVEAMRRLWSEDVASFDGAFVRFEPVLSYPKPVRDRRIPVVMGGNSDGALRRAAAYGDGWYGFNLTIDEVPGRIDVLASACRAQGRAVGDLEVNIALREGEPADRAELDALGVHELVVVESPPVDPSAGRALARGPRRAVGGPAGRPVNPALRTRCRSAGPAGW